MTKIFISYSSKNRELVNKLADDLELLVYEPHIWFDRELLRTGGQKWWDNILAEILKCEIFIYSISPQMLSSEPCKREYEYATALGKPILPVMLTDTNYHYLPGDIQPLQIVSFTGRTEIQRSALGDSIKNIPKAHSLPDPLPTPPDAPLHPAGVLFAQISTLVMDDRLQHEILFEIDYLNDSAIYKEFVPELLEKFIARDDVLIARHLHRAQKMLVKTPTQRSSKVKDAVVAYLRDHPEHKDLSGRKLVSVAAAEGVHASYRTWNEVKKILSE